MPRSGIIFVSLLRISPAHLPTMVCAQKSAEGCLTFGKNYAVLNLDLMTTLVDGVKNTTEGQRFVSNFSRWNDAVHKKYPRPLTIFTSLSFNFGEPELTSGAPFTKLLKNFGSFITGSPEVQIVSDFMVEAAGTFCERRHSNEKS